MSTPTADLVRPEHRGAWQAAVDWSRQRCASDAERALLPSLLLLLAGINATVAPVSRRPTAAAVDLRVTLSAQDAAGLARRWRFAVRSSDASGRVTGICEIVVEEAACRDHPWQTAAGVAATMLEVALSPPHVQPRRW